MTDKKNGELDYLPARSYRNTSTDGDISFKYSFLRHCILGNLLIIVALQKPSSLHPPSKLLLGCLATTDLCVSLIIQPLFVINLVSSEHYTRCYYVQLLVHAIGAIFCGVSLLTLTAMSVDRLLAVMLGLRYRQLVTLRRVWILVAFFGFIMLRFRPYCFTRPTSFFSSFA